MEPREHVSPDLASYASRLRFPGDVEVAFRRYHTRNSLVIVRAAIILTIVLYGLFGILDIHAAPLSKHAIWFIRFAVVIPVLLGILFFSFHPYFPRVLQPMMVLVVLTGGAGILAMINLESHRELGYQTYYAGLILVIIATHSIYRLRFAYATLSSILVVLGYELIVIFHQKLLVSGGGTSLFISNNFFFLSSMILGMTTSYSLGVCRRTSKKFIESAHCSLKIEKSW